MIVIPAWNEEESIPTILEEIKDSFPDFDILVVDDGSNDSTARVAQEYGVFLVSHDKHRGYAAVMQTGRVYSLEHGYSFLIFIDADGQHRVSDISLILELLSRGEADQVRGSRELGQYETREPFYLKIPRWICSALVSLRTGQNISDATSGFIGENQNISSLFKITYQTSNKLHASNTMHIEEHLIAKSKGLIIAEVPTVMRNRYSGRTKCNTGQQLLRFPFDLLRTFARNL